MGFLKYAMKAAKIGSNHYFNQPRVKGFLAERDVHMALKDEKHRFHDVKIHGKKTTQIDHIIVNKKGIIVIETKNYAGVIIGKENEQHWIQIVYGKKRYFMNPIIQNQFHIKTLKEFLPEKHPNISSIIVFSSKSDLNLEVITPVIKIHDLKNYIVQLPDDSIDEQGIEDIATIIKKLKDGTHGLI